MESKRLTVDSSAQHQQHRNFKLISYSIVVTILYASFLTLPATQAASNATIAIINVPGSNGSTINNDQLLENQISDSFAEGTVEQTKEDSIESVESINHSQEIDINSIEDGLLTADKAERHHYDGQQQQQQQQLVEQKQALVAESPTVVAQPELAAADMSKPEQRNQQDQQVEQIIIDHRPIEQQQQQQANAVDHQEVHTDPEMPPMSQSPQLAETPGGGPASESNLHPTFASSNSPAPSSTSTTTVRYNQVDAPSTQTAGSATSWRSSPVQFNYPSQQFQQQRKARNQFSQLSSQAHSQPNQQSTMSAATSSFAPIVASSSNQVVTVQQQYPTSINSIINDQQQQQPVQFSASLAQPTAQHKQQQQQQQQQQQMVTLNGQPASVLLVSPSGTSTGVGVSGGRRISITGWLRGISNMLANMFNRRDHGLQLNGQSSNPIGHWIQLGPNAPHWLSQAQTLLHSQQQQYQQQQQLGAASSNRYATFVQAPQQQLQQQPQTMTITMQPATILTNSNQQLAATTSPVSAVGGNDLQASSSAPTYTLTQIPIQQQQQQQQQVSIAQYNQQPAMSSSPQQPAANQQQQVHISAPIVQPQQTVTTRQAGSQQIEQQQQVKSKQASSVQTATQTSTSGLQTHQLEQQQHGLQAVNADNYQQQQQSSAWSAPVALHQQQQATPTSAPQIQTRHISKSATLVVSNSNLPLAHYSRFASSSSD